MDISKFTQPVEYSLPASLLQDICNLLVELPAKTSRGLLNQVEAHCQRQDGARQERARNALMEELRKEDAAKAEAAKAAEAKKSSGDQPPRTDSNGDGKNGSEG